MLANMAFSNISFSISCDCFVKARLCALLLVYNFLPMRFFFQQCNAKAYFLMLIIVIIIIIIIVIICWRCIDQGAKVK